MAKPSRATTLKKRSFSSQYRQQVFQDIPEIGKTWRRWYDIPYNALWWIIGTKRNRKTPQFVKNFALHHINNLLQYNEFDRLKAWNKDDRMHNLYVPDNENVAIPAIIMVELFTPNEAPSLEKYIRKNGWNKQSRSYNRETNSERLAQARSRDGLSWWRLADVVSGKKGTFVPDSVRGKLPVGCNWVQLKAIQIGSGLTAVVARFSFDDVQASRLDKVWHSSHEPILERSQSKGAFSRLRPLDRKFATFRATQTARNDLHKETRAWISRYCPGYFASHHEPQVSLDVMLTEKYNPVSKSKTRPDINLQDSLRALGLETVDLYRIIAPEMPDMLLTQADRLAEPYINTSRTWALIGNRQKIQKTTDNFKYYGGDANQAVAHIAEENLGYTLILLAVSELLLILESQYAKLRDGAGVQHKKFKVKSLNDLGEIVLESSLTLASVRQDVANLQQKKWWFEGANFVMSHSPYLKDSFKKGSKPLNLSDDILKRQAKTFRRLSEIDRDYRDILTTVSSLGTSANNIKLGRWALLVSALSLIVAIIALGVSYFLGVKT